MTKPTKIKSWENAKSLIEYPKKGIISKELYKDSRIDSGLFCMARGTQMSEHTSTKFGIIQVLEGKGLFILEGEKIKMLPGVIIFMNENAVHSLSASENTSFVLSLVK